MKYVLVQYIHASIIYYTIHKKYGLMTSIAILLLLWLYPGQVIYCWATSKQHFFCYPVEVILVFAR